MKSTFFPSVLSLFSICGLILSEVIPLQAQDQAAGNSANVVGTPDLTAEIRTPKAPSTPQINGPSIFGVRPAHPFLYHIPATGDRPMKFSVESLPAGLKVDAATGQMTGSIAEAGAYTMTLRAKNALGVNEKKFKVVVGETIAL